MNDLGTFLQLLKPSPRLYAAVLITTAALLLTPDRVFKSLSLDVFVTQHRPIIAIAALGSAALLLVEALWSLGGRVVARRRRKSELSAEAARAAQVEREERAEQERAIQVRLGRLQKLTRDEKAMLRPFVSADVRSRRLRTDDGTLHALKGSNILGNGAQTMNYDQRLGGYAEQVFIQPWALEHLKQHPELLDPGQ
jgi:hypothetical protein